MKGADDLKCEKCGKNEANIQMKNIFNGIVVECYICEKCVLECSFFGKSNGITVESILKGFLEGQNLEVKTEKVEDEKRCFNCNMSYSEFRNHGKLGCDNCYSVFREELKTMFEKMNRSSIHMGKVPTNLDRDIRRNLDIYKLKRKMEFAVKNEQFEQAAELRDEIKRLQG